MSEKKWHETVGHAFPWPDRGEYLPCENLTLEPGEEPDDYLTGHMVQCLEYHLGTAPAERINAMNAFLAKNQRRLRNQIADEAEDTMTAFGKIPGSRDSATSLALPNTLILKSGGTPLDPVTETGENLE